MQQSLDVLVSDGLTCSDKTPKIDSPEFPASWSALPTGSSRPENAFNFHFPFTKKYLKIPSSGHGADCTTNMAHKLNQEN